MQKFMNLSIIIMLCSHVEGSDMIRNLVDGFMNLKESSWESQNLARILES